MVNGYPGEFWGAGPHRKGLGRSCVPGPRTGALRGRDRGAARQGDAERALGTQVADLEAAVAEAGTEQARAGAVGGAGRIDGRDLDQLPRQLELPQGPMLTVRMTGGTDFAVGIRKIAPALIAGCSLVLKPHEDTPISILELMKLADEAGVRGQPEMRLEQFLVAPARGQFQAPSPRRRGDLDCGHDQEPG